VICITIFGNYLSLKNQVIIPIISGFSLWFTLPPGIIFQQLLNNVLSKDYMFKSIFFGYLILLFCGNINATSYYLSTASSGSASGNSWTNKQLYTNFSWTKLAGGDTVYVDGGTDSLVYSGKITISSLVPSSQVVMTNGKDFGHNGKAVIKQIEVYNCKRIKLTGLTFETLTSSPYYNEQVVYFNSSTLSTGSFNTLENCHIISDGTNLVLNMVRETKDTIRNCNLETLANGLTYNQDGISCYAGGGGHTITGNTVILRGTSDVPHTDLMQWDATEGGTNNYETVIANNFFSYISPTSPSQGVGGLYFEVIGSNRFLIYNNIVVLKLASPLSCLVIAPTVSTYNISARVYNNTFINGTTGGYGTWFRYLDSLIFKNNIVIDDNAGSSVLYTQSGLGNITYKDIDYNQYYINGKTTRIDTASSGTVSWAQWQSLGYDTHGSNTTASFVNIYGSNITDYQLTSTSTGTNLSSTFNTDITGNIRPSTWSKGAVETMGSSNNTFYVASNGNDANTGTSILSPWKSISKVNSKSVNPGDKILFRRGDTWSEVLTPTSSGNSSSPIIYDCYGAGNLPTIDGGSVRNNCISLNGVSYVTIRNFRVQNSVVNSNGDIHAINTNNLRIESCDCYITSHGGVNIESSSNAYIGFCSMSSPVTNSNNHADGIYSQKNSNCVYENNNIIISDMGTGQNDGIQSYLDVNMIIRNKDRKSVV
jgi:hypothetical protein